MNIRQGAAAASAAARTTFTKFSLKQARIRVRTLVILMSTTISFETNHFLSFISIPFYVCHQLAIRCVQKLRVCMIRR